MTRIVLAFLVFAALSCPVSAQETEMSAEAEKWYNNGVELFKLGYFGEAIEAFNKAIEIKPDYAEAWCNKGVALGGLERYEEAIEAYNKAIEINPDFAEAWFGKAIIYSIKGNREEALKNLSKAIKLDPKLKQLAKENPAFNPLRDDEEFKKIVE